MEELSVHGNVMVRRCQSSCQSLVKTNGEGSIAIGRVINVKIITLFIS